MFYRHSCQDLPLNQGGIDRVFMDILVKHGKTPHETGKEIRLLTIINDIISVFT